MLEAALHMSVLISIETDPVTELLTSAYNEESRTRSETYSSKRKRRDTTFRVPPLPIPFLTITFRKIRVVFSVYFEHPKLQMMCLPQKPRPNSRRTLPSPPTLPPTNQSEVLRMFLFEREKIIIPRQRNQ